MNRTITVKGTGKLSLTPDTVVVSLTVRSIDKEYDKSMEKAAKMIASLRSAAADAGFRHDDLKTTNFNVCTEYESIHDGNGNYRNVFKGYSCIHGLKLEFDFDTHTLSRVLAAVCRCIAEPELNVAFTVKDKDAVSRELLRNAAQSAREKAEILAEASGVCLGALTAVDYNWGELNIFSPTPYNISPACMEKCAAADMSFTPDDIDVSDSVTFVWEIV